MTDLSGMNVLTDLIGIKYPLIQGPFGGGLSSIPLLSTVSNAGGLGSFGAHHLAPDEISSLIRDIRKETEKPFNINLWVSTYDEEGKSVTQGQFDDICKSFRPYYEELGVDLPDFPDSLYHSFEEQVEAVIQSAPKVLSFVYGIPSADVIERCKARGIVTVGTATTLDEAIALEQAGLDAIIATGFEAGGHRVSFLKEAEDSLMGSLALIPQVVDAVNVPVIAAGGIADERGVRAALALGASGVQVGTAFLACDESNTSPEHRRILFTEQAQETTLSRAYTGRLARFIKNKFIEDIEKHATLPADFPIQSFFVGALKKKTLQTGSSDFMSMYSSQAAALLRNKKAKDVFEALAKVF